MVSFRVNYIDAFMFNHGFSLTLCMCLLNMLHKLNISSVVLGINFFFFYRAGFYQNRCVQQGEQADQMKVRRAKVLNSLKWLIISVSTVFLFEYLVKILAEFVGQLDHIKAGMTTTQMEYTWRTFVLEHMCPMAADPADPFACYRDWNAWLSIDASKITNSFFVLDLFTLILAYVTRYFVSENDD
jgi:hypothetical protein